jgi:hypothetical protein
MATLTGDNLSTLPAESNVHTPGAWYGPRTNKKRPEFTGAHFTALREKAAAERAGVKDGVPLPPRQQLAFELGQCAGLPLPAARALAREITTLREQVSVLQSQVSVLQQQLASQRPPHLAKAERRG